MSPIWRIPNELIIKIFLELDALSIMQCRAVCTRTKLIVDETAALQYQLELAIAGYEHIPSTPVVSIPDCRYRLRQHIHGWRDPEWSTRREYHPAGDLWSSFGGGVFVTGSCAQRWFAFLEFPSHSRGTPVRRWRHDNVDINVMDFCIDPDQDLMVLFEQPSLNEQDALESPSLRFHIRTMSDGEAHPIAIFETVEINVGLGRVVSCNARISDERFGALVDDRQTVKLLIVNWITSTLVAEIASDPSNTIHDYSLIDPDHFIVTRKSTDRPTSSMEFYHISGQGVLKRIASFHLPLLLPNVQDYTLAVRHTRPYLPHFSRPHPRIKIRDPPTFQCASHRRIVELIWIVPTTTFKIIFQRSMLETLTSSATTPLDFEWECWGPKNTRFWNDTNPPATTIDNGQYVTTRLFGEVDSKDIIIITPMAPGLNLPRRSRESGATSEVEKNAQESSYQIPSSSPTFAETEEVLLNSVTTTLPCRCDTIQNYDASSHINARILSDEEHIIWLSRLDRQGNQYLDILTLVPPTVGPVPSQGCE